MYRLMLYYLIFLVAVASILSFIGLLSYNGLDILGSAVYLSFICWLANKILAKILKVKTNPESALISGLILSLILDPSNTLSSFMVPAFAGTAAMVSKYLIAWRGRHIFNPAAFGSLASVVILGQGASWWAGVLPIAPFILIGGFLILKKIRRFEMVVAFFTSMILLIMISTILSHQPFDLFVWLQNQAILLFISPLAFFSLVMLVEPLTSPFKRSHQIIYATLIAILFFLLGNVVSYPLEVSLLIGNIFAYVANFWNGPCPIRIRRTGESDKHLVSFYENRGYRTVGILLDNVDNNEP